MADAAKYRFDPVDHCFMRLRGQLSPGERLQSMLAAREWVVGAMRSRLTLRYPNLSPEEINLKILEEIDRVERRQARPQSLHCILRTLERIGATYMMIGGFAATMYGITRTTFDIDIIDSCCRSA